MTVGSVSFNQTDGNLGGAGAISGRHPVIVIGAADSGDLLSLGAYRSRNKLRTAFTGGPLVQWSLRQLDLGNTVIPIRVAADAVGSCSAVDNTHMTVDGSVASVHTGAAPTLEADIKVYFSLGGEVATGPITYEISYDGGVTYTLPQSLGTATHIDLTEAGTLQIDLTTETITTGDYFTLSTTVTAAGTVGSATVTRDALSTLAATSSGVCNDAYEVKVVFVVGGAATGEVATYRVSRDNGRTAMGPTYKLAVTGVITVPDSGGVVLTCTGTIVAGDVITLSTTAPGIATADLQDALDLLAAYRPDWKWLVFANPALTADAAAVELALTTLEETYGTRRCGLVAFRKPSAGESEAAYLAAYTSWRSSVTSPLGRIATTFGACKVYCDGLWQHREAAFSVAPKQASVEEQINIANVDPPAGALSGVSLMDFPDATNAQPQDHDEFTNPGADDLQAITLRTWPNDPAVYVNWPKTLAAAGSDYGLVPRRLVMDLALDALYAYERKVVAKGITINKRTGKITDAFRARIDEEATAAVEKASKGKASGVQVRHSADDDLTAEDATLTGDFACVPLVYPKHVVITTGFATKLQR